MIPVLQVHCEYIQCDHAGYMMHYERRLAPSMLYITLVILITHIAIYSLFLSPFSHVPEITIKACARPVPQDGIVIPIIQTSQRNDPVTFKCKDGYQPNGELSTLCLQNGTWTMDPNDVCLGWYIWVSRSLELTDGCVYIRHIVIHW